MALNDFIEARNAALNAAIAQAIAANGGSISPAQWQQIAAPFYQMDYNNQDGIIEILDRIDPSPVVGEDQLNDPFGLRAKTAALKSTLTWGGSAGGGSSSGGGGGSSGGGSGSGTGTGTGLGSGSGSGTGTGLGSGGGTLTGGSPTLNTPPFSNNTLPPISYLPPGTPGSGAPGSGTGMEPGTGTGLLSMQQTSPQTAVNNYLQTPVNQLLGDPSYQRFQHSPGYQYAVDEALGQVQRNAASRGLLESGRVMRDMTDRAQNMALQDYGNWWNRQNQLYGDYQNRLAGLAGGPTGSDQAYGLGQAAATGTAQTGSNLGSLFGNQGSSGFGGITNTGAAQANAMTQAGNQQAQILAANQATQLAGALTQQQTQNKGLF